MPVEARAFLTGLAELLDHTLDIGDAAVKIMLVDNTYVFDPDETVVDNGNDDTSDPSYCEIVATNYTGGFAGAGRKAATVTFDEDTTNDRVAMKIADLTWSSLGGAANDTIGGALLIWENTADTDSRLIAWIPLNTAYTTNGADWTADFDSDGVIFFNV